MIEKYNTTPKNSTNKLLRNENNEFKPSERAISYFKNTKKEVTDKVYQLFKLDFLLFKYSINEFL